MKTSLMPTQVADIEQIAERVDLPNFSEPGTGKTLTTVGAIEGLKLNSGVIVCPSVASLMWQRVLSHELGARVQWLKGRATAIDYNADFWVMSYGVVADHLEILKDRPTGALVVDESHYVKNSDAARTRAIFGPEGDGGGGLYERSEYCFCLTGTPIERYADDLWSQLRATQPGMLQYYNALSLSEFQQQFCRMELKEYADGAVTKWVSTANANTRMLNRMLYNPEYGIGAIRRTMAEVDPFMPETTFRDVLVKVTLPAEYKSLLVGKSHQEIVRAILNDEPHVARARRLLGVAKATGVVDYVREQAAQHPVLVGFWHQEVGKEIYMQLMKNHVAANLIWGGTSAEARDRVRVRFMNGDLQVIVGQIQAMGVAMDGLQEAGYHVIFAERDWSWAKMEQFYKRIARKGQRMSTQVDFCTTMEPIDTALEEINDRKREGMEQIVG